MQPKGIGNPVAGAVLAASLLQAPGPHDRDNIIWITAAPNVTATQLAAVQQSLNANGIRGYAVMMGGLGTAPYITHLMVYDQDAVEQLEEMFFRVFRGE